MVHGDAAGAETLRRIWLPQGLPVEDGFIAAMLVTDGFTRQPDARAIGFVGDASHYYEPVTDVAGFVRHEARIIVGSVINAWLFTILWEAGKQGHTGAFIRHRNAENPHWVEDICAQEKAARGGWLVPRTFMSWRFAPLRRGLPRRALVVAAAGRRAAPDEGAVGGTRARHRSAFPVLANQSRGDGRVRLVGSEVFHQP